MPWKASQWLAERILVGAGVLEVDGVDLGGAEGGAGQQGAEQGAAEAQAVQ